MKIQLKINGEWAVLPPDFYLKMMKTSPLFSDQGDFSYPFELPVEPNRHIFGPIADPMGFVRLREFHALPAEIWFEGNQVFVGQTEISGEQTFSQRGKVSFNVVSNNGAFKDMISGLNCRDVKLKDQILLGWRPSKVVWTNVPPRKTYEIKCLKDGWTLEKANYQNSPGLLADEPKKVDIEFGDCGEITLPPVLFSSLKTNVDEPYPAKLYCNIRMCCANSKDKNQSEPEGNEGYGYKVMEVDRFNSAPNFFVLYFLDCLFGKDCLDVSYDNNNVMSLEDLKRLAFVNAYPFFDDDLKNQEQIFFTDLREKVSQDYSFYVLTSTMTFNVTYNQIAYKRYGNTSMGIFHSYEEQPVSDSIYGADWRNNTEWYKFNCYANSKNFPDVGVTNVVQDLTNAFGVVFDYNQETNFMKLHLVRDIMKSTDVDSPSCTILAEPTLTRSSKNGQILSYGGDETDTTYNCRMPIGEDMYGNPDPIVFNNFLSLSASIRRKNDTHTYYDGSTGNAFRIKVNEDTGNEPQFFKVGSYRDYKIGVVKDEFYRNHNVFNSPNVYDTNDTKEYVDRDESESEKITINFKPVIVNDVWSYLANKDKTVGVHVFDTPKSSDDQDLCVWVDAQAFNDHDGVDVYHTPSVVPDKTKDAYYNILQAFEGKDGVIHQQHFVESIKPNATQQMLTNTATLLSFRRAFNVNGSDIKVDVSATVTINGDSAYNLADEEHYLAKANVGYRLGIMRGPGNKSGEDIVYNYDDEGNNSWTMTYNKPAFTADSVDNYGGVFDYNGTISGGADVSDKLSLLLDARKVKGYDDDGNPIYFDIDNIEFARRGLVPQLLEDFLYFKAHHVKVTFPVLMSLSAINNLQLLKWNRFGDYVGLIKQVNYELTESGLRNVKVELLVANK